uniref:Uncharacterized protein n=1 Tax=Ursus americanus TaxID=9643 RepID=A0A452QTP8_URSAM
MSLFVDGMIVYIEIVKESTKKPNQNKRTKKPLLELISNYSKVAGYEGNIQKSIVSYISAMNKWNLEFKR